MLKIVPGVISFELPEESTHQVLLVSETSVAPNNQEARAVPEAGITLQYVPPLERAAVLEINLTHSGFLKSGATVGGVVGAAALPQVWVELAWPQPP